MKYTIALTEDLFHHRFDKALAMVLSDKNVSRAQIQRAIKNGDVVDTDGKAVSEWPVASELTITIENKAANTVGGEAIDLDIVFEDDHLLVINKPVGLVVHPGAGNWSGTLVNGLVSYLGDEVLDVGDDARPGLVHRLDKDTSGLMVVAKTEAARVHLSRQLAERTMHRLYEALVWGTPPLPKMDFDGPIGRHGKDRIKMAVTSTGRDALTHMTRKTILVGSTFSRVECILETGRTHQIRVHLSHAGFPIVGDQMYGLQHTAARARLKQTPLDRDTMEEIIAFPRQALHARELMFIHPETGEDMHLEAALPDDFAKLLQKIV